MHWWQLLLFPISILYGTVMSLRNRLYDIGIKSSQSFDAKIVAVGNLSVGGTGKTPMVSWITQYLSGIGYPVTILSRGYGRWSKGFIEAHLNSTWRDVGDEPVMYLRNFPFINVVVCEKRLAALKKITAQNSQNSIILLDDAYQHRSVKSNLSVLMTKYHHPFYDDYIFPAGRLREARKGASRSQVVIVSDCPPDLSKAEQQNIKSAISQYALHDHVFFTSIVYLDPKCMNKELVLQDSDKVVAVSGIAHSNQFEMAIANKFSCLASFQFRDHYPYSQKEVTKIDRIARGLDAAILITEKDAVKWEEHLSKIKSPVFYWPINHVFNDGEYEFKSIINSVLNSHVENTGDA